MPSSPFPSVTRLPEDLPIVCASSAGALDATAERLWALPALHGPFAFPQTGVIASFAQPLAKTGSTVFVVSTFDTDHGMLDFVRVANASQVQVTAGHAQR